VRCPSCGFVGPDSRDLCSRCQIDLRPQKKAIGLPISNAWATREELLKQIAPAGPQPAPPTAPKPPANVPEQVSPANLTAPSDQIAAINAGAIAAVGAQSANPPAALPKGSGALVLQLFAEAKVELPQLSADVGFEMNSEQEFDPNLLGQTQALFNLSAEILRNPAIEEQLLENYSRSEDRSVESKGLTQMLGVLERKIAAPVFGLKNKLQEARKKADQLEVQEPSRELPMASWIARLSAFSIDLCATIAVGAALGLGILRLFEGSGIVGRILDPELFDWPLAASIGLATSAFCFFAYPFFSLCLYRQTLGLKVMGLRLVNEGFRRPRLSHCTVWAMCLPLSLLVGGQLPLLVGKRSLHDRLSKTLVCAPS
jgi:uncharacterized RDD family membrane protein YckC